MFFQVSCSVRGFRVSVQFRSGNPLEFLFPFHVVKNGIDVARSAA